MSTTGPRNRMADFCHHMDDAYIQADHTDLLIKHLEALEKREINKLAVFMPPRHGKTYHVSERFPAWYLGKNEKHRVILASYAAELAQFNSRRARALVQDQRFPFPVRVSEGSSAVNRWDTDKGGGVIAAGVGGGLTGFGADLLIIDDPVKDRADADSETRRDATWQWYQEVARTRKMPGGVELLAQTRWHEDDLAGRILNSAGAEGWIVVQLPAIAEAGDALGRSVGEALWPTRFPAEALPSVEQGEISSRAWKALYQQQPTADEGGMFKRAWWKRYRALPQLTRVEQYVDSAFKEGVGNDWTVIATWGGDASGNYYVLEVWRARVEFPELVHAIRDTNRRMAHLLGRSSIAVVIEDKASGQSAIQQLKRDGGISIIPYKLPAGSSKISRADGVTSFVEAGRVHLPEDATWVADFVDEHAAFPTGKHDDMVDTTSMALDRLSSRRKIGGAF